MDINFNGCCVEMPRMQLPPSATLQISEGRSHAAVSESSWAESSEFFERSVSPELAPIAAPKDEEAIELSHSPAIVRIVPVEFRKSVDFGGKFFTPVKPPESTWQKNYRRFYKIKGCEGGKVVLKGLLWTATICTVGIPMGVLYLGSNHHDKRHRKVNNIG